MKLPYFVPPSPVEFAFKTRNKIIDPKRKKGYDIRVPGFFVGASMLSLELESVIVNKNLVENYKFNIYEKSIILFSAIGVYNDFLRVMRLCKNYTYIPTSSVDKLLQLPYGEEELFAKIPAGEYWNTCWSRMKRNDRSKSPEKWSIGLDLEFLRKSYVYSRKSETLSRQEDAYYNFGFYPPRWVQLLIEPVKGFYRLEKLPTEYLKAPLCACVALCVPETDRFRQSRSLCSRENSYTSTQRVQTIANIDEIPDNSEGIQRDTKTHPVLLKGVRYGASAAEEIRIVLEQVFPNMLESVRVSKCSGAEVANWQPLSHRVDKKIPEVGSSLRLLPPVKNITVSMTMKNDGHFKLLDLILKHEHFTSKIARILGGDDYATSRKARILFSYLRKQHTPLKQTCLKIFERREYSEMKSPIQGVRERKNGWEPLLYTIQSSVSIKSTICKPQLAFQRENVQHIKTTFRRLKNIQKRKPTERYLFLCCLKNFKRQQGRQHRRLEFEEISPVFSDDSIYIKSCEVDKCNKCRISMTEENYNKNLLVYLLVLSEKVTGTARTERNSQDDFANYNIRRDICSPKIATELCPKFINASPTAIAGTSKFHVVTRARKSLSFPRGCSSDAKGMKPFIFNRFGVMKTPLNGNFDARDVFVLRTYPVDVISRSGHVREGRQVMRRNNGWLAVLAVTLVLSNLNSLAGERYPLDYDNDELPVNRSRTIYETYNPNELTSSPIAKSRLSSFAAPQSTRSRSHVSDKNVVPSTVRSANPTNVITRLDKLAKLEGEEQSNSVRSILHNDDPRRRTKSKPKLLESGAQVVEGSRSFNLGVPRQSRLSSWIRVSRWISHANPAAKSSKVGESGDNDSLAITARRIGDDERGEPSTRDVSQIERSSSTEASVLKTAPGGYLDLESVDSPGDSTKIVKKRFLTGYSVFSVSLNRRLNKLERLNKLVIARRSKDRRGGKERRGRSVALYLKRGNSLATFGDGDRPSDRFEKKPSRGDDSTYRESIEAPHRVEEQSTTTRHDDPRDERTFDSASIRGKRNSPSAFDSSNDTFHDEESSFDPIEGSDNFTDRSLGKRRWSHRSTNRTMSADRMNETIPAEIENYSNTSNARIRPSVSETSVLPMYKNDSEANSSVVDDINDYSNEPANRAAAINSRSNANAPRDPNDESALTSTDMSNDLIDGTELDASGEKGAIKERGNEEAEERNSPTTGHGGEDGKIVENFNVNSLAERSSVNNEEQAGSRVSPTAPPGVSKNAALEEEVAATSSGRDDESLWGSSEINDEATPVRDSREPSAIDKVEATSARGSDRGTLNGPTRIDLEEGNSGPIQESLNRNVGANESAFFAGSSLKKNDRPSSNSSNVESGKKIMVNLEHRIRNNDPLAHHDTTDSPIDDRDSKERKYRSSKASTPRIEDAATSTPNKDENLVPIDSTTPNQPLEVSRARSNGSFQFLSKDPPVPSTTMAPTTKQPDDLLATSDATLSSTEDDQLQTLSTIPSINDEDQLLGFDATIVVTSLGSVDDEDLRTTVSNVSLRGTDNSSREMEPPDQWPVKHSAVVEGDLVLGGLMMVHEREDTITCGPVMSQGGIQALEAMLYTLDRLNDLEIVPGVKIGAHILDDCDKDTYGLEMAVDFIKGTYTHNILCTYFRQIKGVEFIYDSKQNFFSTLYTATRRNTESSTREQSNAEVIDFCRIEECLKQRSNKQSLPPPCETAKIYLHTLSLKNKRYRDGTQKTAQKQLCKIIRKSKILSFSFSKEDWFTESDER
ncbi:Metabotropic glutamate receptor 2 [Melipona quadrifasciata]|uniref:Metabotropic glutamate receptor 2 n=1 Tax=Melipona quadrifasciata TaxID=166423 RepID=A0A0M8ZT88_9HYME|nr:Metabotropic glutamate receptor 2 [Melipona quadrifasciata]